VAKRADASGSLALSRRPRTLPTIGSSAFRAASVVPPRNAQPAEIAQARVFERLLQTECAELQELAHRAAGEPPGELAQLRSRIDEIDGLLRALRGRFPHSTPVGDR
jgi:hypothetical protein